jgi:hypothetical protein
MANALARGGFVVSVELAPPRGFRPTRSRARAPPVDPRGWTSSTCPTARAAAGADGGALAAAILVQQQAGVETDPPLRPPCRDRDLLGMQSDCSARPLDGRAQRAARHRRVAEGAATTADATAVRDVDSIGSPTSCAR